MPTHRGSCHCGRIRFEADGELTEVSVCNCSICERTGYLHWYVPPASFRLVAGEGEYDTYEFGTRVAKHHFCRTCGISPFRVARADPDKIDVNARCLEGVDPETLPVSRFDGRNWEAEIKRRAPR
ncbi:MAG: GFA family protein [Myxococcota bacterium]